MNVRQRLHAQVARAKAKIKFQTGVSLGKLDIDYDAIIKKLGQPEGDISDYEIDHVVPLSYFLNGSKEQLEQAFHPANLRWLNKSENRKKSAFKDPEREVILFDIYNL